MNKELMAYCGLDCEKCEARIATITKDEALRAKVAAEWSEMNHVEITPAMIHCFGCRVEGAKTPYCEALCPIRQCALKTGVEHCGKCLDKEDCALLAPVLGYSEEARENLKG